MSREHPILVTAQDLKRLRPLLDRHVSGRDATAVSALDDELARATIVDQAEIPQNVVTMNSRVVFEDQGTGREREVTLVYPEAADPAAEKVSVLAPVGMALLGLSVGQSIDWPLPGGRTARLRIIRVTYQPEASGETRI